VGVCPILAFSVDGRDVFTLPGTDFNKGECSDLKNGTEVDVTGVLMSDGLVRADKVTLKKPRKGIDELTE
jgi:hypothetical protein